MQTNRHSVWGLLGLVAVGSAAASTKMDLGLWESMSAMGDGAYAVARADEIAEVAEQLSRGFVMDEASSELVRTLYRDLLTLNLGRLYAMLPAVEGDARWMGVQGAPTDAGYSLSLVSGSPERTSASLGDLAGWIEMVPVEERFGTGTPYAVDERIEVGTGATGPSDIVHFISGVLKELERAVEVPQPEWALEAVRAAEPRLKGSDAQLLAAIYASLPTGAAALADVVDVRGIGSQVSCGERTCLAYDVDLMLDPVGVRKSGFRNLAETIRRWENLAQAQARIRLPSGSDVAHVVVRTDPAGIRLRFLSLDGKIVPVRQGKVSLSEAFSLENLDQQLEIEVRGDVQYEGFALEVRKLKFPGRLVTSDKIASFSGRINQAPELTLTGTDAFRSSLANFADSTLGIGDHGRDLGRYVAEGRNGRGSPVKVELEWVGEGTHVFTQQADTVLLDNSLIRFAFRVVGGRLIPDEKSIHEFGSLMEQVIGAVITDYRAVRPELARRQEVAP